MTAKAIYRYGKLVARHGPRYPYWRSVFPRRILQAEPVRTAAEGDITLCALTSAQDWLACLWMLVSFYETSGRRDPLLILSDGTLRQSHWEAMQRVFPDARLVERAGANPKLEVYPLCREFRGKQPCALRILDFPSMCGSRFILMLDSDILFVRQPAELNGHLQARRPGVFVFQTDMQDAYAAPREFLTGVCGAKVPPGLNCGILLADVGGFRYDWIEEWLAVPGMLTHPWSEQTLWAMYGARHTVRRLGAAYPIEERARIGPGIAAKHYIKPIRDWMYVEGIPYVARLMGDQSGPAPRESPAAAR